MLIRALLPLVLPVSGLVIHNDCPPSKTCSDRQFCDQRGQVTTFRTNKLSFSTDLRGLQVRGLDCREESQISPGCRIAGLPGIRGWGSAAGGIMTITLTLMRNKYRLIIIISLGIQRGELQPVHCCLSQFLYISYWTKKKSISNRSEN